MALKERPSSKGRFYTKSAEEERSATAGILPSPPSPREELRSKSKSSKASHTLKSLFAGLGANGAVRTGRSETQVLEEAADPGFNDDADFRPPTGTRSKPEPAGPKASTPRPGSVASVRPRYAADRLSNKPKPSRAATVSGVLDLTRPATSGSLHLPSVRSRARPAAQTIDVLDTMTSDLFASAEEKSAARRLSFAEESLDEVAAAIREEEPELDWLQDCWRRVLVGAPAPECKTLLLRSLHNWVEVYNRWQALGGWVAGQAPMLLDAYQFQETLAVPMLKAMEWVKLFDPVGHAKLQQTRAATDHRRVKVPMPAFLTAAIFLSSSIFKRQKVRFLLGVFDENDSRTFEIAEFTAMLSSFFQGISCAFCLQGSLPRESRRLLLGKQLFHRILESARMRASSDEVKSMLDEGSVLFPAIEDWFLGLTGDPLSAPFALFLERFSVRGLEDDPEVFEDEERKFRLSHTAPVDAPMETAASLDSSFLRRSQIKVVRDLFNHCAATRHFAISHAEAEEVVGTVIEPEFWIKMLARALEDLDALRQDGVKFNMGLLFKKLCPRATARHHRMFQTWLKELQQVEELEKLVEENRRLLESFQYAISRPMLPAAIRQEIMRDFAKLDMREMAARSMLSAVQAAEDYADIAAGMSKEDFVFAMCPKEYRAKEVNPVVDKVICELLTKQLARNEELLAQKKTLFTPHTGRQMAVKSFLKAEVPESAWALWNQAFDILDVEGQGYLSMQTLIAANLFPLELCHFIRRMLADANTASGRGVSKEMFLQKLVDVSDFRLTKC